MSDVKNAVVIGAGPAGLMVAEQLGKAGIEVDVYDAMPSVGRKFLRAGIGGLNLTHSEPFADFVQRYRGKSHIVEQWLSAFNADDLRDWAQGLGIETFVGSSGRVFPTQKKAAPLLRAWLSRLRQQGVRIHTRHRWLGWDNDGALCFQHGDESFTVRAAHTVFALGGSSWARLGSDGRWKTLFEAQGIRCVDFRPSNCGFEFDWSAGFREAHSGQPLKGVALQLKDPHWHKRGDAVIASYGLEGSLIYGASLEIRDRIEQQGECPVYWDLLPDKTLGQLQQVLARRKPKDSVANVLRKQLGLSGLKLALFKELTDKSQMQDVQGLPALIKQLPQTLRHTRPLDEAISTDGGICFSELTPQLMLKKRPGVYCVGEMLDWETVTGGYLLTACFASAVVAGRAIVETANAAGTLPECHGKDE